ncbi:DUF4382 domain-containing protein [Haloarcula marina]|uniref:DUF4382 domain-containing protein n=1 Tax=Haloarcula marina TaxID=2961574 RepID=UPI0020B7F074|nr:DUF4382 domain-containing protein [Halomicroarcula marina]
MDRRAFLRRGVGSATALGVGAGLGGCSQNGPMGTLATAVGARGSDFEAFESFVVSVREIRVLPAASATATEEHRADELVFEAGGKTVDLVGLTDGETALVHEQSIASGPYAYLKLTVGSVDATLEGGKMAKVTALEGGAMKFNRAFEIQTRGTTRYVTMLRPVQQTDTHRYRLTALDVPTVTFEG